MGVEGLDDFFIKMLQKWQLEEETFLQSLRRIFWKQNTFLIPKAMMFDSKIHYSYSLR